MFIHTFCLYMGGVERVKGKMKCMKGCHAHQLPSYLDEFKEHYGDQ